MGADLVQAEGQAPWSSLARGQSWWLGLGTGGVELRPGLNKEGGQAKGPGPRGADRGSDDQLRPSTAFFKVSLPTTSSLTLTDVLVM